MTPTYYHPATQTYFTRGDAFTLDGVRHPAEKWADTDAITALGLVPVVDIGTPADPRYFVNTEELVGAERRVISTPKSAEVLEADAAADEEEKKRNARAVIAGLEAVQIAAMARKQREDWLSEAEAAALAEFGVEPADLYAMGKAPNPPPPARHYAELKDIDDEIKRLREGASL
jgi:hypothetical protein